MKLGAVLAVVAAIIAGVVVAWQLGAFSNTPADKSAEIAQRVGAEYCERTDFYIENKIGGGKTTIYDCFLNVRHRCVTYENGIARDSTDTVRLLFESTLGESKPTCAAAG